MSRGPLRGVAFADALCSDTSLLTGLGCKDAEPAEPETAGFVIGEAPEADMARCAMLGASADDEAAALAPSDASSANARRSSQKTDAMLG